MANNDVLPSIEEHIQLLKREQMRLKLLRPNSWLSAADSMIRDGFSAHDLDVAGKSLLECTACLQSYVILKDFHEKKGRLNILCSDTEQDIDKEIEENKSSLKKTKVLQHLECAKELISDCRPPFLIKKAF